MSPMTTPRWLYKNYASTEGTVRFYDLLFVARPYGSNEAEEVLTDDTDALNWHKYLNNPKKFERQNLPTLGARYYPVL